MKVNSINISEEITKNKGIEEINLSRLSNVIGFIGKNGCGKTRILDLIEEHLFSTLNICRFLDKTVESIPQNLKNVINKLEPYKHYHLNNEKINILANLVTKNPDDKTLRKEYNDFRGKNLIRLSTVQNQTVSKFTAEANKMIAILKENYLRRIEYSEIQELQKVIEDNKQDKTLTFENLVENVSDSGYDEFKSIHKTALKYLSKLPNQLTSDFMDCLGDPEKYQKRVAHKRYLSLKRLFKTFLDKELTWEKRQIKNVVTETGVQSTSSGIWKINDRDFNYTEFSDGEKTLFAYALLFFLLDVNPKLKIKNSIILVDEPELHLHPDSEIDLINAMRETVGETGQLIFATHSISILSSLNYNEIFMVKNGAIKFPSQSTIGESLNELINLEERVSKLSDFLSSISTWTFINFMAECFSNPEVIESSRTDDPQIKAFKEAVNKNSSKSSNLLLDFGAGKGRVYEQLKLDYDFINKINYSALEPDSSFHSLLKKQGAKQVYEDHNKLPANNFNFILLCNVLHEIPIIEWIESINKIIESLKDDGFLVIIEAKTLTKGEKIGKEGFILLDLDEIRVLFNLNEITPSIKIEGKEDVVTCAVLSKKQLKPINKTILMKTLKSLQKNTLNKIIELREEFDSDEKKTVGFGRKHAFLSQLHINSQIAQKSLK
jgi:ABC-type cobalamin/Fe3+-siderophores transport system ATPase subunit